MLKAVSQRTLHQNIYTCFFKEISPFLTGKDHLFIYINGKKHCLRACHILVFQYLFHQTHMASVDPVELSQGHTAKCKPWKFPVYLQIFHYLLLNSIHVQYL